MAEKNITLGVPEIMDRTVQKKKILFFFLDSALVFEHEQKGFCEILENYSSFSTREIIVIKF